MNITIEHISNFLQGYLIQEQFIWSIPNYILFALGIMNELQNIAYINAPQFNKFHKLSYEIYMIKIISRPNTLINNNKTLSYFAFCHLNCFLIFCFLFTFLMRNIRNNVVTQLGQHFQDSFLIKILMIYLNISINIIKLGYGYLVFEISLYQIKENINDSFLLAINSYILVLTFILIPIVIGFFSYNWALDFHKQHMIINETNLTEIRILIRFIQIFISIIYQDDQFFEYIQIILPILYSTILIYQMQVQKIYIYGIYYQIILFINIMEIVQSSQYLCILLFQIANQRLLWLLISIIPFYFIKNQTKEFIEKDFLNSSETNIVCKNLFLYQMIYNSALKQQSNSVLHHLLYICCHKKQCLKLKCQCHQIIIENTQQLTLDLYIQDLLLLYKTQLNCMSFKCSKDQIIFSYLQLLFFKKKYLTLYKYFEIIFKNITLQNTEKNEQQYKRKNLDVHQNAFQITNFYKLSILRVAQCLIQLDIQKEFILQQTSLCKEAQKYHYEITNYINFENQKKSIQATFSNIIRLKIDYFNSLTNQKLEHNLQYELIDSLIKCKKLIKQSNKYFSIQEKQNMLIFYNMELLNDLITSFNYSLEKDKNQNEKIKIEDNLFSNHISYLLVQVNDQNDIQILQQQFKDINNCIYEKQTTFQQLIPDFFTSTHSILVDRFVSGQSNKFFQQFNEAHIQLEIGLLKRIELIMDINQVNLINLEIIMFIQEKSDKKYDIIVDQSNKILCFDEQILEKFGCDFQFAKIFIGQNISSLIPKNQDFNINQKFTSQQIRFQFLDQQKLPSQTSFEIQNSQQAKKMLNNFAYFCEFQAEVEIIQKGSQEIYQYQIFRFKNINKIFKQDDIISASDHNQATQLNGSSQINESIFIKNPYNYSDDEVNEEYQNNILQNNTAKFKERKLRKNEKLCLQYSKKDTKSKKVQSVLEAIYSEKNLQILNKQTERASTQQSLQKLEFYKQFRIVHELLNSKKKPKSLHSMIMLILLIIIISLIGFSFYLYEIDIFHKYNRDFKLLKIKNDIFYPILSFQVIRFSFKMITPKEYQELIIFPQSKIIGSYELLKEGITQILEQNDIFEIFDDEQFTLSFLQNNDHGIHKKQGLRETLATLLNYQYDVQDSYIKHGSPDTKSPYFYFQYKNFPSMFNQFQIMNEKILDQCIKNTYLAKNTIDLIAYSFITTITILEIGLILFSFQVQIQKQKLKKLLSFYDPKFIQYEIQRLEMLLEQIEQNSNLPLNYQLNLNEKEYYFRSVKEQNKVTLNVQKQNNQKKQKIQVLHFFIKIIHFMICFLIFFLFHFAIEQVHKKVQNTIYLYQNIINLNINTLVIFLTRDVIYYKSAFSFLDENDVKIYYQINKDALDVINDYVEKIFAIKVDDYFIDKSFFDVLKQFSESNLCVEINKITDNNFTICSLTLNGMLQKGFSPTIINLKNSITTEFDLTNFTNRTQYPKLELEGVYLLCYSLQHLLDNYSNFFFKQNQDIEVQYTIIIVISLVLSVFYGLFLLKYVNEVEWKNFELLMKFFYIVPQSAIILDDSFLRNTRIFIKNDNLI